MRLIHAATIVLAAVLILTGAMSCGGSGETSGTGGSTGASTTSVLFVNSQCGICVETDKCVAQLNACAADPSCTAYLECLDQCPLGPTGNADTDCEKACPAVSGSAGIAAKSDFVKCRTSGAGVQCAACGEIEPPKDPIFHQMCPAEPPPEDQNNKCYSCEDVHCCSTYEICHTDADCKSLGDCVKACPGDSSWLPCVDQCYQDHPSAFAMYGDRLSCVFHFCSDADACGDVPLDPCLACDHVHCADEDAACSRDLQCTLLRDCETPCDPADSACRAACEGKFPSGMSLLENWTNCVLAHCDIICGGTTQ